MVRISMFHNTLTLQRKGVYHVLLPVRTDVQRRGLHQDRRVREDRRRGRPSGSSHLRAQGTGARCQRGPPTQARRDGGKPLHAAGHVLHAHQCGFRPGPFRGPDRQVRHPARGPQTEGEAGRRQGGVRPRGRCIRPGGDARGPGGPGRKGRRESAGGRCRCPGVAGTSDLRAKGGGRLCRPRLDPGPEGRERLHLHPRGPGRHAEPSPGRKRLPGPGAQVRRGEPESHGAPGRGQHRRLRTPDADQSPAGPEAGQGHPGIRPRPEGPGGDPEAERRQGHQRLHPRRDAALPRVPRAEAEVPPFLRPLRHGLAEPGQGVRQVPRGDPHDHQLHPETHRHLPGQHLHLRSGGLARCAAHRRQQLQAGHRKGAGAAPASARMPPARRSWSALGATP